MRNTYIVCYDTCEPKRLRDVFKVMRGWGDQPSTLRFRMPVDASRSGDAPRGACGNHRPSRRPGSVCGPRSGGSARGTASSRGQANRTLFWILPASLAGYAGCNENFVLLTTGITGVLSFEL